MSEESDQVWERMSGELRQVRRRRAFAKAGALVGMGVLGVFLAKLVMVPLEESGDQVVDLPVEAVEANHVEAESARLAVLVYDGEGMRFELMDGERLGSSEMEFSLQPVVWNAGVGESW